MKGHERPLTFLKYNRDGDLLFSCAKDHTPTVWYGHNGERLGTYRGHNGAVWCCDVSSKYSHNLIISSSFSLVALYCCGYENIEIGTSSFFDIFVPTRDKGWNIDPC